VRRIACLLVQLELKEDDAGGAGVNVARNGLRAERIGRPGDAVRGLDPCRAYPLGSFQRCAEIRPFRSRDALGGGVERRRERGQRSPGETEAKERAALASHVVRSALCH
jgi:hypothetical protein